MSPYNEFRELGNSRGLRIAGDILSWIVAPLLLGWLLSLYLIPKPAVGLIRIRYDIFDPATRVFMEEIKEAYENPAIKAVVVQIDSPGGASVDGEAIYLELQKLRQEKPVVGSVDSMAASAAYHIAVATEPIFAKGGSRVGNVGTWSSFPPESPIDDFILASGPFKLTADTQDEFVRGVEESKQRFLATVFSQRGQRLKLTPAELSQGLLYSGQNGERLGLIDRIGSQTEAVEAAAEQAGLSNYEVVDLEAGAIEKILGPAQDETSSRVSAGAGRARSEELDELVHQAARKYYQGSSALFELWPGAVDPVTGELQLATPGAYPTLRGAP